MAVIFLVITLFALLSFTSGLAQVAVAKPENVRERLFKIKTFTNGPCLINEYRCQNNRCIERHNFCNGKNDCGDNSDENYCRTDRQCPNEQDFIRCGTDRYKRCVPNFWKCDGSLDCFDPWDEMGCDNQFDAGIQPEQVIRARHFARNWILNRRRVNESRIQKWGMNIPRTAIAYHFAEKSNTTSYFTMKQNYTNELAYELSISLLSKLALKNIEDLKTSELATYVNSFLAFCINPRKFYKMIDLVEELRKRVNADKMANPYAMLALCNAREFINENDIEKLLIALQKANADQRIDTLSIIIMALACASTQPDSSFNREELTEYTLDLKRKQYRNGSVENIKTTALVLQALFASDVEPDDDNFDEEKAIKQILRSQEKDGSFGGLMNTYYVLPVLSMSSLANITGEGCPKLTTIENEGLEYLKIQLGVKWDITYSIWIGDDKVLQRSLTLSVPANTSFYGVMEYAAGVDDNYRFEYNVRSRKPYIFALSGIMDDPEMQMFWYPYYLMNNSTQPTLISKSPADVKPNNNDHVLFWYRKVA